MSLFSSIRPVQLDPVVVSFEAFLADRRSDKVNLGVGMYYDDAGNIPLMHAVALADRTIAEQSRPWGYIPVEGLPEFRRHVQQLVFGSDCAAAAHDRIVTLQTVGGTGAIRLGADLLHELAPEARVAVSDPSWPNHPPIFEAAGFETITYPYYDAAAAGGLDIAGMLSALDQCVPGTVVVLHACCHNPTGADLSAEQWRSLKDVMVERELVPFVDLAYQGFGLGIEEDAYPVRLLADAGLPLFVATSFSKSFALYGERVGALFVVTPEARDGQRLLGQIKNIIRTLYSTPPTHGAAVVGRVLGDAQLNSLWRQELDTMRGRVSSMREGLVERLRGANMQDFSIIARQRGLFSYSGLSPGQVASLRDDHAIYTLDTGRICVAAINTGNIDRVAEAIRRVM
jgi:aromatic-amino-acid transaminase